MTNNIVSIKSLIFVLVALIIATAILLINLAKDFFVNHEKSDEQLYLEYKGDEIYKAVKDFKKLSGKGFLIEAEIVGKVIGDPTDRQINVSGIIYRGEGGTIFLKLKDGTTLAVGGSMAYREDISAERIVFIPLYTSTIKEHIVLNAIDLKSLVDRIKNLKNNNSTEERVVAVSGFIVSKDLEKIRAYADIHKFDCYYCLDVKIADSNIYINLVLLSELEKFPNINISYANLDVYFGGDCSGVEDEICIKNLL